MPSKIVELLMAEVAAIQQSLKEHLDEGITIKTRLTKIETHTEWIKWLLMLMVAGLISLWIKP